MSLASAHPGGATDLQQQSTSTAFNVEMLCEAGIQFSGDSRVRHSVQRLYARPASSTAVKRDSSIQHGGGTRGRPSEQLLYARPAFSTAVAFEAGIPCRLHHGAGGTTAEGQADRDHGASLRVRLL